MTIKVTFITSFISVLFFYSCVDKPMKAIREKQELSNVNTFQTIDSIETEKVDHLTEEKEGPTIQKYFYPNKSHCGGAVYGFYKKGELIRIESIFDAELGYTSRNIDFKYGKIVSIKYHEFSAEWDKYSQNYPNDEGFDPKKMTYSDTLYILTIGKVQTLKKFSGKKLISTKFNEELTEKLLKCAQTMVKELETEKLLVKK